MFARVLGGWVELPIDWVAACLVGGLVRWLGGCLAGWLHDWLVAWLAGWLVGAKKIESKNVHNLMYENRL